MTNSQANDILLHLIASFQANGYGEIISNVQARLIENLDETDGNGIMESRTQLKFYLKNSIEILSSFSVNSLERTINRINESISGDLKVTEITIEQLDGSLFNLANMNDYQPVITMLEAIQSEISNE
jgi:hypothetical protein